ncbi:MAG: GAF domain-containing protein, partial [Chloroflexi bacterium]|nr:GAF domain-containing protein [Chloroflexota bacterium]
MPTKHNLDRSPSRLRRSCGDLLLVSSVVVAALVVVLFLASLPAYYDRLQTACVGDGCLSQQLMPASVEALRQVGVSMDAYAAYFVALAILFAGVYTLVAALIVRRAARKPMALVAAVMLALFGPSFSEAPRALGDAHPALSRPVQVVGFLGFAAVALFVNLFPGGRFTPRWTRWAALVWAGAAAQGVLLETTLTRPTLAALNTLGFLGGAGASLVGFIYRYRRATDPAQRQQVKWVVYGLTVALGGELGFAVLGAVYPALGSPGLPHALGVRSAQMALLLLIPLAIGAAVREEHLWDIDLLINRTLVYAALTACIVGLYALIVGGLGARVAGGRSPLPALLATGLLAVAFAPLRERLQRAVNRLLWGERDEPASVLSRLGRRLEATLAPEAVLPTVIETVAQALKLPYAAIALRHGDGLVPAAVYGTPRGETLTLPLVYRGETIGQLTLAPRAPGEGFTPADWYLLDALARQVGVAAHAVGLTADLQRANDSLQ